MGIVGGGDLADGIVRELAEGACVGDDDGFGVEHLLDDRGGGAFDGREAEVDADVGVVEAGEQSLVVDVAKEADSMG